uniref:Uncharacterized protein n=1 Tax=Alexandrium monilatum TaxID=311494 RepID=A0A7S4UMC0_9DINO
MDTPSGRSHQGSRSGLGRRSASQGALPQTGRTRQHASYGAWFQAQQTDDRSAEVIRLAKPTSYWPYGKDVTTLAGTGNARDVYKILGSHDARGVVPKRPAQETLVPSNVLRNAGSTTALLGPASLLGSSFEAR